MKKIVILHINPPNKNMLKAWSDDWGTVFRAKGIKVWYIDGTFR